MLKEEVELYRTRYEEVLPEVRSVLAENLSLVQENAALKKKLSEEGLCDGQD